MTPLVSMNCPDCAAPLTISGNEAQTTCQYCGTVVVVPAELRQPPPARVLYVTPTVNSYGPASGGLSVYSVQATSQGKGCLAPILILVLTVAIFGLIAVLNIAKSGGLAAILGAVGLDSPVVATFGGEGTGAGLFTEPATLAIDGQDNIYVGDGKTGRIQQFDPNGKYVRYMQFTAAYNGQIRCMAASPNGTIYACDVSQVLRYNGPTGEQLPGAITLQDNNWFDAIATTLDGSLIVCACSNGDRLYKFNSNGQLLSKNDKVIQPHQDGSSSIFFTQMAVDGLGNIYVLDGSNAHVFVFKADGTFVNRFGSKGKGADQFSFPLSIAVDGQSNVYVGDGRTVKVFDKTGRYFRAISLPSGITYSKALAFNSKGVLIALGYDKKVYELNVATAQKKVSFTDQP